MDVIRLEAIRVSLDGVDEHAAGAHPALIPGPEIQISPEGAVKTLDGRPVNVDEVAIESVLKDRAERSNPGTINFEHEEDPRYGKDAAGEFTAVKHRPGVGIFAAPSWTPQAIKDIREGKRTWISPEYYVRNGRISHLRALALVSTPNQDNLQRVNASAAANTTTPKEKKRMEFPAGFLESLGLSADATGEQVATAVTAKLAPPPPEAKGEPKVEDFSAVLTELEELKNRLGQAEKKTEEEKHTARVAAIVAKAVNEGRVLASEVKQFEALAAARPEEAEKFAAALPVRAPVNPGISLDVAPLALLHSAFSVQSNQAVDERARQHMKAEKAAGNPVTYEQAVLAVTAVR